MPETKDIILVEDSNDDVLIFEMALKQARIDYTLRHAENGDILFVLLRDKIPYILFLDIRLPGRDGISCIVEIRKNRKYDTLPVVMYTASFSNNIIEECYRSGANLYVTKTDTIARLANKLKAVFSIDWSQYLHYPPSSQFTLS